MDYGNQQTHETEIVPVYFVTESNGKRRRLNDPPSNQDTHEPFDPETPIPILTGIDFDALRDFLNVDLETKEDDTYLDNHDPFADIEIPSLEELEDLETVSMFVQDL